MNIYGTLNKGEEWLPSLESSRHLVERQMYCGARKTNPHQNDSEQPVTWQQPIQHSTNVRAVKTTWWRSMWSSEWGSKRFKVTLNAAWWSVADRLVWVSFHTGTGTINLGFQRMVPRKQKISSGLHLCGGKRLDVWPQNWPSRGNSTSNNH